MARKLARIQRPMDERPEMFDFGDKPADHKISPAQEAPYDALAPDWVRQSKANRDHLAELTAKAKIEIDDFKANFICATS